MKALQPTSIRLSGDQKRFLRRTAKAEKHGKLTTVIKRLIDREMASSAEVPK